MSHSIEFMTLRKRIIACRIVAILLATIAICPLLAEDKSSSPAENFYTLDLQGSVKGTAPITFTSPSGQTNKAFALVGYLFGPAQRFEVTAIVTGKIKNLHTGLEVEGITMAKILDHQSKVVHHLYSGTALMIPLDDH